ncbi:MAG: molybdenum cofactor biosynthesis protein MoaE [Thiotrichaceae bacterium]
MDEIKILTTELLPWKEIETFQETNFAGSTGFGATASFVGTMRDFNEGDSVTSMFLEHYPKMTEQQLGQLVSDTKKKWDLLHTLLVHRVGEVKPAQPIVLVATWSAHRAAAFDSCRFVMEELKSKAPFWKKEKLVNGASRWVEKNTIG